MICILAPADYGLFAMTQVMLVLLNMLNGYGLASALTPRADAEPAEFHRAARQLFGMLILLNVVLGLGPVALAPLAAAYFRHPEVAQLLRGQGRLYVTTPFSSPCPPIAAYPLYLAISAWRTSPVIGGVAYAGGYVVRARHGR